MNRLFLSLISLAACMSSCTSPEPLTDYVDPVSYTHLTLPTKA